MPDQRDRLQQLIMLQVVLEELRSLCDGEEGPRASAQLERRFRAEHPRLASCAALPGDDVREFGDLGPQWLEESLGNSPTKNACSAFERPDLLFERAQALRSRPVSTDRLQLVAQP